jgi:phosphatidylserine decarboxylase
MFICDPNKENHGFTSWDDFFTRLFRDGIRPVASPENDDVIANACESKPYRVAHDVKRSDDFWVKGQPYSIMDMLAHDSLAEEFVGGTVYQAFLSALSYHRWHSPISGKVVKTYIVQGTYYSEPLLQGFENPDGGPDPSGEGASQAYLTEVATRAFIYIQADNPKIGLMCVMPVGMVEVSTCDVTVKEGQHIKKGDQLGMVSFSNWNASAVTDIAIAVPFRRLHALPLLPQGRQRARLPRTWQGGERSRAEPTGNREVMHIQHCDMCAVTT